MDPLIQIIFSTSTVIVAAVIAIIVGSRKGIADVEARGDAEMSRLVVALEGRIRILVDEIATAAAQIVMLRASTAELKTEVGVLKAELQVEQRITSRLEKAADK